MVLNVNKSWAGGDGLLTHKGGGRRRREGHSKGEKARTHTKGGGAHKREHAPAEGGRKSTGSQERVAARTRPRTGTESHTHEAWHTPKEEGRGTHQREPKGEGKGNGQRASTKLICACAVVCPSTRRESGMSSTIPFIRTVLCNRATSQAGSVRPGCPWLDKMHPSCVRRPFPREVHVCAMTLRGAGGPWRPYCARSSLPSLLIALERVGCLVRLVRYAVGVGVELEKQVPKRERAQSGTAWRGTLRNPQRRPSKIT